ncbi:hypothetical protein ACWKWU_10370 [Chitinophaga lutea]
MYTQTTPVAARVVSGRKLRLQGLLFKDEKGVYHAYLPALDLCGYGSGRPDAKDSLKIVLRAYLDAMLENNGLEADLLSKGWLLGHYAWLPPVETQGELVLGFMQRGTALRGFTCVIEFPEMCCL